MTHAAPHYRHYPDGVDGVDGADASDGVFQFAASGDSR